LRRPTIPARHEAAVSELIVRPYAGRDRRGLRAACVDTAWLGAPAPERILDPELWADVFTRYFTDREREHTWVVEDTVDRRICGYLTGARDVKAIERHLVRELPRLLYRLARSGALLSKTRRGVLGSFLRSLALGQLVVPTKVREEFPARFLFALSEDARGRGLGPLLFTPFLTRMSELGVAGAHTQTLSVNEAAFRFLRRAGFQLVASWPLSAFERFEAGPIDLCTWVLPILPSARR
jgi:GNAT superfamily N-acetyltransferase